MGFENWDKDRQRSIASSGGRAAHAKGTAHEWTAEQARQAGRKGGARRAENKRLRLLAERQAATPHPLAEHVPGE
jgi:general stress protein YciG